MSVTRNPDGSNTYSIKGLPAVSMGLGFLIAFWALGWSACAWVGALPADHLIVVPPAAGVMVATALVAYACVRA